VRAFGQIPSMRGIAGRVALGLAALVFSIGLLELGVRAIFVLRTDPSIFFSGTRFDRVARAAPRLRTKDGAGRWDIGIRIDEHGIKRFVSGPFGHYSVYKPDSVRTVELANGEAYEITHNNFGFRGSDFARSKAPGAIRVITLGASSTFGYLDRDDETYPYHLEQALNARLFEQGCGGVRRFEVLNFGIPHLDSDQIRALFLAEVAGFQPDVVTFYEGANDTRRIERPAIQRALLDYARISLTLLYLSHLLETRLESFSANDFEIHLAGRPRQLVANVAAIARGCAFRGFRFVVATQQARSFIVPDERMNEVGYLEEVELVKARLASGERLDLAQLQFLLHAELMAALRAWATQRSVHLVDFIAGLERAERRDGLQSWVHLTSEANRVLASMLAEEIYPWVCGSSARLAR
jgi:hypothetical protein